MPRPAMYSPDISQHSPGLYRLGQHFGVPMTVLADRLIRYGLQNLEHVIPDQPGNDATGITLLAEVQTPYGGLSSIKRKAA